MYLCKSCDSPIQVSTRWNGEAFQFEFHAEVEPGKPQRVSCCPVCGGSLDTLEDLRFCELEEIPELPAS